MRVRSRSAREDILSEIKLALSRSDTGQSKSESIQGDLPVTGERGRLVELIKARCAESCVALAAQFETELAAVGGLVHHASNAAAVCDSVVRIAATHHARSALGWDVALIEELGLVKRLEEADIQFFTFGQGIRTAEGADIGITTVDYALADTGTLVVRSGDGRARSASLLPPVHIALLKPHRIIGGLDDLFPLLAWDGEQSGGGLDSAVALITGPSRTADIELTLVVGVHGPQELHVILIDE
jgi:L-lactate utilization protein LutC